MHVLVLIEPKEGGGFRATAGEPFRLSAEAVSEDAAARELEKMLRERLQQGSRLAVLEVGNGSVPPLEAPLRLEPLPADDWFFAALREAIEENRQREQEAPQ
jgi:hypothetical protein